MLNTYIYPAIFRYEEDIIYISFPDIDYCFTDAQCEEAALINASEVLGLCIYELEVEKKEIPLASCCVDVEVSENEIVVPIQVNMQLVRDEIENTYTWKSVRIPKWLNDRVNLERVNLSRLLQEAIKDYLGIKEH